jgi:acetyltransferase
MVKQADNSSPLKSITFREIQPTDAPKYRSFLQSLSYYTSYYRFFRIIDIPTEQEALTIISKDPANCVRIVGILKRDDEEIIAGYARYEIRGDRTSCEFDIVVADAWQGNGIGKYLMNALLTKAEGHGLLIIYGYILSENSRMLNFIQESGFEITDSTKGSNIKLASRFI